MHIKATSPATAETEGSDIRFEKSIPRPNQNTLHPVEAYGLLFYTTLLPCFHFSDVFSSAGYWGDLRGRVGQRCNSWTKNQCWDVSRPVSCKWEWWIDITRTWTLLQSDGQRVSIPVFSPEFLLLASLTGWEINTPKDVWCCWWTKYISILHQLMGNIPWKSDEYSWMSKYLQWRSLLNLQS